MEYTQWANNFSERTFAAACLNPCCNGIYSMSLLELCYATQRVVLILVVMEYTQWVRFFPKYELKIWVLILVVMEYTQWEV